MVFSEDTELLGVIFYSTKVKPPQRNKETELRSEVSCCHYLHHFFTCAWRPPSLPDLNNNRPLYIFFSVLCMQPMHVYGRQVLYF